MPTPNRRWLTDKAVLWPALTGYEGTDSYGDVKTGPPENVLVRWEDKQRQGFDSKGTPIVTYSTVMIDQDVPVGSILWYAPDQSADSDEALDQWYGTGSAGPETGLMSVSTVSNVSDIKGRVTTSTLGLEFYRNRVPNHA